MVKKKLVEELISDGAILLRELDRQNFLVESMFWATCRMKIIGDW